MGYGQYSNGSHGKSNPLRNEPKTSKRQVFPTDEVPHKWAHAAQESARNAQGNLYFRGPTIYSYRDSWPLARIYTRKDGRQLVLTNSRKYSVTTAAHQSSVNRAASHMTRVDVPIVEGPYGAKLDKAAHDANFEHFVNSMQGAHKAAGRAMQKWRVESFMEQAVALHKGLSDYVAFFNIRRKLPPIPDFIPAMERAERIESPDPVRDAKRFKAKKQRADAARVKLQAIYDKYVAEVAEYNAANVSIPDAVVTWRATGSWPAAVSTSRSVPYLTWSVQRKLEKAGFDLPRAPSQRYFDLPVLLRINGEQIETSLGARVPVAAAPMVWHLVKRAVKNGGYTPDRAGLSRLRIGDYPLDGIDADGTLHAGCHTIPYSELQLMADALGLEEVQS